MGLLEEGAAWLSDISRSALSVEVEYRRREGAVKTIPAVIGRTLFRAEDPYGVTIRVESRDFIVSAKDADFTPERGDVIVYLNRRYEVLAPNGEPVWRWSGTGNNTRRIHTKEIGGNNEH